jgi:hypothetical protein
LRTTQEDDIAGKTASPSENPASKVKKLVDGREHCATMSDMTTEVDDPVALLKPLAD